MLRVAALREVGGVATRTLTEDFHTTMRLHRAGWRTAYHNEVLARGLAAGGPDAFYTQRTRWGRGAMQVLRTDSPIMGPGLTWQQRVSYAYSISAWFDSWRTLGLALVPVAVLLTGLFPVAARPLDFVVLAGSSFLLQQLALTLLGRGFSRAWFSLLFDIVRLPSNLAATVALLAPGMGSFAVTAKGRTGAHRSRASVPRLLVALAWVLTLTVGYGVLALTGLAPSRVELSGTALVPLVWLLVTDAFVLAAVVRIRDVRFGAERREGHRFLVGYRAALDGRPARLVDVSLGGAQVRVLGTGSAVDDDVPAGGTRTLAIWVPDRTEPLVMPVEVRAVRGRDHRLQFVDPDWRVLAALSATTMGVGVLRWSHADDRVDAAVLVTV